METTETGNILRRGKGGACPFFALWIVLLIAAAAGADDGTLRREDFRDDPLWEGLNNRLMPHPGPLVRQDFGYRTSGHAGGLKPGEIGGFIQRSLQPARYSMPIQETNLDAGLHASGKFSVTYDESSTGVLVGWFHEDSKGWRTPNSLAFRVDGNGGKYWVFYEYGTRNRKTGGGGAFIGERYQTTPSKPFPADGTPHRWSLDYDPAGAEGNGRVTFMIDDARYTVDLRAEDRADGAVFDRFGIWTQEATGGGMEFWLDDLEVGGQSFGFDADPGWIGEGNRTEYRAEFLRGKQDYGFSDTDHAGGDAGEIGGVVWRDEAPSYYADKVGPFTLDEALFASGKVAMPGAGVDSAVYLGWFDSSRVGREPSFIGILIEGPSRVGHYFRPACGPGDGSVHTPDTGPVILPDGRSHNWSVRYEPQGPGTIVAEFDGSVQRLPLNAKLRAQPMTFDRFGLFSMRQGGWHVLVFLDDLVYTATPAGK